MTNPATNPATNRETLPEHLVRLPGEANGQWALWRTFCVRGAGFAAADVLRIADAECTAAADRLAAVEAESESLRQAALEALRGELDASGKERLDLLIKAIRRVKRSLPPATAGLAAETAAAIDAWQAAAPRAAAEKESYLAAFAAAEERLSRELREVATRERFREAVVWQNRHAAETGLAAFLRRPPEGQGPARTSARDRGHAQMLASYLQRYSVKNDTIGFFGPVGWGRLSESGETITATPGERLLAARHVYFEGWAIDAIADLLAEEEGMRQWLAPRRSPFLRRENANLYIAPNGQEVQLGPLSSVLFAGCDGTRSARVLMREFGPDLPAEKEAELWEVLADFHEHGLVRWAFQVPLSPTPEKSLYELLQTIEDEPLRLRALAVLDELAAGREAVTRATGDAEALEGALNELEATFTRLTDRPSTRAGGELYAGRTLVFEDCRRDLDLELGKPFLDGLAPALSLVLASARWYTHYAATSHREVLSQVYAELSAEAGSPQLDLLTYSRAALPRLLNVRTNLALRRELQARWERVLKMPAGEQRISYRSEDLLPLVQREFAAPGPGWQKARHHSPDILIAAPSLEAIRQGDYEVILGEIHLAVNTLDRWLFFTQHPDPEELRAAIESDLPEPSAIPLLPKIWNAAATASILKLPVPAVNGRMDIAFRTTKDYYLDFSLDAHDFPPSQVLAVGDLVVEPGAEGGLVVGPRDGRVRFDVIDFYQIAMMIQALETFRVLPTGTYTPRVTIDHMVVARESWIFPAGALEFTAAATPAERFAAARRWAGENNLPRFLFAKTPIERKPFYLDLESPVLVEIFAKAVRRAAKDAEDAPINVSEMLPEHHRLWLPDAEGNRYTCELRLVAVDLE